MFLGSVAKVIDTNNRFSPNFKSVYDKPRKGVRELIEYNE